jgi:ribonuclease D
MHEPPIVTDAAGVERVVAAASAAGRCALDTEFLWEKTYAPQLCLVQIAVGDEITLIDPVEGAPLAPIAHLIADAAVEKVMHAPAADLTAFRLHHGVVPAAVTDTQVMAGFVGLGANTGLDRLLEAVLKVRVEHHESFSDWSLRPLTDAQAVYAADDVRFLLQLADALRARLVERGRLDWAEAELARRTELAVGDPDRAWRKVQRRSRLAPQAQAVLIELARWREQTARRRDQPVAWVIKDPTLVEIARSMPTSPKELGRIRGVGSNLAGRDAEELLAAVERGRDAPPPPRERSVPASVARRVDALGQLAAPLARVRCADADLAPELVANRADLDRFLEAIVRDEDLTQYPLGQGWRRELLGDDIVRLAEGRLLLGLNPSPPYLHVEERSP